MLSSSGLTLHAHPAVARHVDRLELEVDADGRDEHGREVAGGVLQQQARLADARIAHRQQLDLDRHQGAARDPTIFTHYY